MSDLNAIANSFVSYYYQLFDTDRASLKALYKDMSMLTFEGQQFQGAANISQKLAELPFQKVKHEVVTYDAQPSNPSIPNAILVLVTGRLLVDDSQQPIQFTQTFQLLPDGSNYFVLNDVFRLNYG